MDILLYFCLPTLISFSVQLLIDCRTIHKILRHIPLYFFVLTLIFAVIALSTDPGFVIGGNIITAMTLGIMGLYIDC
jgi:uncharacterized membrane protein